MGKFWTLCVTLDAILTVDFSPHVPYGLAGESQCPDYLAHCLT